MRVTDLGKGGLFAPRPPSVRAAPKKPILNRVNNSCILNPSLKNYPNEKLLKILLYGSEDFNCNMENEILKATIIFLKISERFNGPLFWLFLKSFAIMVLTFCIFLDFFNFSRYMCRTYFKRHVTFSMFCVLFSLVLAFFISCNL